MTHTPAALPERIDHDGDLDRFWRTLMGPLGFQGRRLWLVVIEPDGRPARPVMQVDDVPHALTERAADDLVAAFGSPLVEGLPGGSLAVLFSRPGRNRVSAADRELARRLIAGAVRVGVPLAPVYFANDVELRVLAVDDLVP